LKENTTTSAPAHPFSQSQSSRLRAASAILWVIEYLPPNGDHQMDGHMREVRIELSSPFPFQAGAMFMATLAYSTHHRTLRDGFFRAICRSEVLKRACQDRDYEINPQLIPPAIFSDPDTRFWSAWEKGMEQLKRRSVATFSVLIPYLGQMEVGGKILSVKDLSEIGARILEWSPKSSSNFIDEVWVQTRPVAHVMIPYFVWWVFEAFPNRLRFELCPAPRFVAQTIKASEDLRQKIPILCKKHSKPLIREEEMIKFLPAIEKGTLDDFIASARS
jgi:hypothetical protein